MKPNNRYTVQQHAAMAEHLRSLARGIAGKLDAGEPLDSEERDLTARCLRQWADNHPDKPPGMKGQPPQFQHWAAAIEVELDAQRIGRTEAIEQAAERYGVTIEAIKKAIKPHRDQADAIANLPLRIKKRKT